MLMKRNYYIVALIMLTFFVISFVTNVIGPLVPDIISGFNLSLTLVALLPFAFFIAYGVMSIPSGLLIEKYNEKKMMVVAFIISFGTSNGAAPPITQTSRPTIRAACHRGRRKV